jgi:putative hydrolase of the HAD superfamily
MSDRHPTTFQTIEAVILDYGEVLCSPPELYQIVRMAEVFNLRPDVFRSLYEKNRRLYDRGDITAQRYWELLGVDAGITLTSSQLDQLRAWDVEMWSRLNPVMVDWVGALHSAGMKTGLLSNMHADMIVRVRQSFAWFSQIDCPIFSHEVRLAKPEPAIYGRCLESLQISPRQAMFIDDRAVNVEAAHKLGMSAIRFQSAMQLKQELRALGFPVLPNTLTSV